MEMKPSFYKTLMNLPPKLGLPKGFTDKYGQLLSEKATLRNAGGKTWKVRIEKLEKKEEDDDYFFTEGWTKFSQDMGLEIFELLVFSHAGNSTFDVSVYAATTLEKDVGNPVLSCRVQLKEYEFYKFYFPKSFATACGLMEKTKVWFEYEGGESVRVILTVKGRLAVGRGWSGFMKPNAITTNKTYSFQFLPKENVIRVRPDSR
ncbi:uncharacterized protein LOC130989584 [Salvia miltiorrhiza]|uniref:uncharacterized protein LOC130989584 n=1 Tax=Salvia miltiorrhiza TaxID=226208 RepID=UPI0025AD501D|nr:uncharacterized protein LOC130989584 [Salvia miltiorrhiza]